MKKIIITIIIISFLLTVSIVYIKSKSSKVSYQTTKMDVVLSLEDEIGSDSVWCGTFNLIWNDLKNELAKQDIVFNPQLAVVDNLNKETFTVKQLNENSYYKVYGIPTLELKKQIEKAIKEKFKEKSDILDSFNWNDNSDGNYFLYAMLKKDFEFNKMFAELKSTFGSKKDVNFFGIIDSSDSEVRNQVKVLYYDNENSFAIKLLTKGNDEVIIIRGNEGQTFKEVYDSVINTSINYEGNKNFGDNDVLKIPNISFKIKNEFKELEQKEFPFSNGETYIIDKAIQTIEFELNKKGGKVKSEAGMSVNKSSVIDKNEIRNFLVNNSFTIFLIEKEKELPYFAAKISNIDNVQSE